MVRVSRSGEIWVVRELVRERKLVRGELVRRGLGSEESWLGRGSW